MRELTFVSKCLAGTPGAKIQAQCSPSTLAVTLLVGDDMRVVMDRDQALKMAEVLQRAVDTAQPAQVA